MNTARRMGENEEVKEFSEADFQRFLAYLRKYGRHLSDCHLAAYPSDMASTCTCGLTNLLNNEKEIS